MVYARIELTYIAFQALVVSTHELHCPCATGMYSSAVYASIRIVNEHRFPNWNYYVHQRVVNYSVRVERENVNCSLLRFVDNFLVVTACTKSLVDKNVSNEL